MFASGDGNRHGCCTHLLATRPPKGKWRSGFSDARIGCCRRWRLGKGDKTPACPWLSRVATWHSRLTTRTARCRLGPTPFGANIRYSKCASRLGHCAVSRADSAASRGSARRRKLNLLRGMGGEKSYSRVREGKRVGGYWSESRPVSQSSEQPMKSARVTASWRVNGRSPVSFA